MTGSFRGSSERYPGSIIPGSEAAYGEPRTENLGAVNQNPLEQNQSCSAGTGPAGVLNVAG